MNYNNETPSNNRIKKRSENSNHNNSNNRRKKKKKNKKKIVLLSTLLLLLFAISFGATYATSLLGKINTQKLNRDDLGIESGRFNSDIINVALFGIDGRTATERGRSDSTMVVSFDKKHNKIKLISLMRDSYVDIDGHGKDKLNHAYAFGGPELAIKTINQNFGLNIQDYASVNFEDLAHIIDELGGVKITIKDYELEQVNKYTADVAAVTGLPSSPVSGTGEQTLTGVQAVAYSRIRYAGDGDYERTQRQRNVLEGLFSKINTLPATKLPGTVSKVLPYVETSMESIDIISLGGQVLSSGIKTMDQQRFPADAHSKGKLIRPTPKSPELWYLTFDKEATRDQIVKYINDDINPTN